MEFKLLFFCRIVLLAFVVNCFYACKDYDAFNNGTDKRNLTVVISDLHLGADSSYAEIRDNVSHLKNFLTQIKESNNIKELVIAGDLLDEWFIPASQEPYKGKTQSDFVFEIAKTNAGVFETLNEIIQDSIIKIIYVPGNHDLAIESACIDSVLPGIIQIRDAESSGVGTYSPKNIPLLAIEHGHRYNFFCAPDSISDPTTQLPPGYFFTRIAAEHVFKKCSISSNVIPVVTLNYPSDVSGISLYNYWKVWTQTLTIFPVSEKFDEKSIVVNAKDTIAVKDLLPYQTSSGDGIKVKLYNKIVESWPIRCALNNVAVDIPVDYAIKGVTTVSQTDFMANVQYFKNSNSDKRLVVFGHTHEAKIIASQNLNGEKSIYVNSGTWIDNSTFKTTMNFVVITPQKDDDTSQTKVTLCNFEGETQNVMCEEALRL